MKGMGKVLVGLCWTAGLGILSCTGPLFQSYGRIDPSSEATRAFEHYQVDEACRYYISGSDVYPNALMALHRDYRLDPRTLWKEVKITPERMKEIVEYMQMKAREYRQFQFGFGIYDDKDRLIGVWYSILTARTFVRMQDDGTVRIDTPQLDTYEQLQEEVDRSGPN